MGGLVMRMYYKNNPCSSSIAFLCDFHEISFMWAARNIAHAGGAARQRRGRRLRAGLLHERMTIAMVLAEMSHHAVPTETDDLLGVGHGDGALDDGNEADLMERSTDDPMPPGRGRHRRSRMCLWSAVINES